MLAPHIVSGFPQTMRKAKSKFAGMKQKDKCQDYRLGQLARQSKGFPKQVAKLLAINRDTCLMKGHWHGVTFRCMKNE